MNEGGKATLIIPSAIAYGSRDSGKIPAYSTLVFEVELIKVEPAANN
jgi:FKBP-type peptidyl-prolyl cis-trans isomerase FkpA